MNAPSKFDFNLATKHELPTKFELATMHELPTEFKLATKHDLPTEFKLGTKHELPTKFELATTHELPTEFALNSRLGVGVKVDPINTNHRVDTHNHVNAEVEHSICSIQ